jgi:hypothetical protein
MWFMYIQNIEMKFYNLKTVTDKYIYLRLYYSVNFVTNYFPVTQFKSRLIRHLIVNRFDHNGLQVTNITNQTHYI